MHIVEEREQVEQEFNANSLREIVQKTYWYSAAKRRAADLQAQFAKLTHANPKVTEEYTRQLWQKIRSNPASLPAGLTLEALSLAIQQQCDWTNSEDRLAFYALIENQKDFRDVFCKLVFLWNGVDTFAAQLGIDTNENAKPLVAFLEKIWVGVKGKEGEKDVIGLREQF
ncbi:MAG: hypothetical protein M3R00_04660, partial [Pseudomonadota bacterium]|nr:hypothetical protein [Pseudomonadota bacterium]